MSTSEKISALQNKISDLRVLKEREGLFKTEKEGITDHDKINKLVKEIQLIRNEISDAFELLFDLFDGE